MIDELNKQRLKEDLIHAIWQFQGYAEMRPLERNNYVVFVLQDLLDEAKKMQLQECVFLKKDEE